MHELIICMVISASAVSTPVSAIIITTMILSIVYVSVIISLTAIAASIIAAVSADSFELGARIPIHAVDIAAAMPTVTISSSTIFPGASKAMPTVSTSVQPTPFRLEVGV